MSKATKPTTTELFRKQLSKGKGKDIGTNWKFYQIISILDVPVGKGNLKVWLGDPCYVLHDEIYKNVFEENGYDDGLYVYDNGTDLYWFAVEGTGGDGIFSIIGTQTTKKTNEFGVDSGCLSIMSANLAEKTFEDEKIYNRKEGAEPIEDVSENDTKSGIFYTFKSDVTFTFNSEPFYIQGDSKHAYFRIWDGYTVFRGISDIEGMNPDELECEYGPTDAQHIKDIKERNRAKPGKYD